MTADPAASLAFDVAVLADVSALFALAAAAVSLFFAAVAEAAALSRLSAALVAASTARSAPSLMVRIRSSMEGCA